MLSLTRFPFIEIVLTITKFVIVHRGTAPGHSAHDSPTRHRTGTLPPWQDLLPQRLLVAPAGLDHLAPTFLARVSTSAKLRPDFPQLKMAPCARPRSPRSSEPEVMAMHAKDMLGKSGEQAAAEYLESCGLRILDRNWRCAAGEIDIVAVERHTLVVAEVKARTSLRYGSPLEAVSRAKRARLRRLAVQWLNAHGVRFDQVRIDVIGLVYDGTGGFSIEHIRGVG